MSLAFDPVAQAQASPYFKRNRMGRALCTLCRVECVNENKFLQHLAGKVHALQLERSEMRERRNKATEEDDERNRQAELAAQREKATREALAAGTLSGAERIQVLGRHGLPVHYYRQEHVPDSFATRVWIDVVYEKADEGTRPLHRWVSAREQHVEEPPDDYYVYLLIACEGYTTIAFKFPSRAYRSSESAATELGAGNDSASYTWNPLQKMYSLFFTLSR